MTRVDPRTLSREGAARRARVEALFVSVALAGNNGASYLVTVVAARLLLPAAFGEFSSLFAVLVIGVVPAMGLQTVVALRVARAQAQGQSGAREDGSLLTLGLTTCATVTIVAFALVPVLVALLHLDTAAPALWLATSLAPLTLLGLFHGLLQGTRRFTSLSVLIGLEGLGKIGGTLVGLVLSGFTSGALAGAATGSAVVATIGWLFCGRPRPRSGGVRHAHEVLHAAAAMLALVLLVNIDLVLARHHLPSDQVGGYAIGAVTTKIAYWLPQAVGVVVLPRMADAESRRRAVPIALALCGALDAVVVAGCMLLEATVVGLVGGSSYTSIELAVWPFALVGSFLALVQILLFSRIASADRRSTALVWGAVVLEIVLVTGWLHGSTGQVVTAAAVSTCALTLVGGLVEFLTAVRRPARLAPG